MRVQGLAYIPPPAHLPARHLQRPCGVRQAPCPALRCACRAQQAQQRSPVGVPRGSHEFPRPAGCGVAGSSVQCCIGRLGGMAAPGFPRCSPGALERACCGPKGRRTGTAVRSTGSRGCQQRVGTGAAGGPLAVGKQGGAGSPPWKPHWHWGACGKPRGAQGSVWHALHTNECHSKHVTVMGCPTLFRCASSMAL